MTWPFELVAGPYEGPTGGVVWHEGAVLFSAIDEGRLLRFDSESGTISEFRRYANRVFHRCRARRMTKPSRVIHVVRA